MSQSWQRVGALTVLPALLREHGVDPATIIDAAGLEPGTLADREGRIPFAAACALLELSTARTGCPHFGVLLGLRNGTDSLGLVGALMREAPTIGRAFLDLVENQHRYVRGGVPYLMAIEDTAWAGYAVYERRVPGAEHVEDAAIAVGFTLMRELAGAQPEQVLISHRAPADPHAYRRLFGVPVVFDAPQTALVFPSAMLDLPVKGADPVRRRALAERVHDYWAVDQPRVSDQVTRLLRSRVIFGETTLEAVAEALVLHPRVLERALAREETSFRTLLGHTRIDVAQRLLSETRLSVTDIGAALGYADTSAFSNAFRRLAGASPSGWRRSTEGALATADS
ncbi:MAG: AraC family transcriptional regulator [Amaricoccus sp.]